MFITADQILCHLVGDYIFQSHWMAQNKTKSTYVAAIHALTYSIPFMFLTWDWLTLSFIFWTHLAIDRLSLAKYVVWIKNGYLFDTVPSPRPGVDWDMRPITSTGYGEDVPPWLAVWLLIIADNTLHLICNGIALKWLAA